MLRRRSATSAARAAEDITPFLPLGGWAGCVTTPPYPDAHGARPPRTLRPSKVTAFTNCPLAFRFSQIEHRPEPPSPHAVKGTLVHAALEGLFWNHSAGARGRPPRHGRAGRCWAELQDDEEYAELGARPDEAADAFLADARTLVDNYFRLEDPNEVQAVGVELGVETVEDGMRLRGIIDRLDIAPDGDLIVVDYKTGRAPSDRYERGSMGGVQTYALLCESLLGRAPAEVRLLHLREPVAISSVPSEQTIRGQQRRTAAVWTAIERACDAEDFRPRSDRCATLPLQDLLPRLRRVTRTHRQ